jgi:hypothetical protein
MKREAPQTTTEWRERRVELKVTADAQKVQKGAAINAQSAPLNSNTTTQGRNGTRGSDCFCLVVHYCFSYSGNTSSSFCDWRQQRAERQITISGTN